MLARLSFGFFLAATVFASAAVDRPNREADEAAAIFGVISGDYPKPERCEFDALWDHYPVPGWIAKEYLGLTLDVDVVASAEPTTVEKAMASIKYSTQSFCESKDYNTYLAQQIDRPDPLHRSSFSFPVFDRSFSTAIIVITHREDGGFLLLHGTDKHIKRLPEMAIIAFVFKKERGEWKVIKKETLAIT